MERVKLFVFGPPRLEQDDQPVELNLRKALALLVYLAVTGKPHTRDSLAAMLWPETSERDARANLRRTLYRLGQTPAGSSVVIDTDTITVSMAQQRGLWLDYTRFQQCVAHLNQNPLPAPADLLPYLTQAADLYTNDFLAGFNLLDSPQFEEWQFFEREGLRQQAAQVLEQLVRYYTGEQQWEPAVNAARRWLALDGLHEPVHRTLMELYALSGQQSAALRQYQECVRILRAELDMEPEETTTELYDAIRARRFPVHHEASTPAGAPRPAASADGAAVSHPVPVVPEPDPRARSTPVSSTLPPAPPVPAQGTRAVGREADLDFLQARLEQALAGTRQVVFVTGEAGLGKTTLVSAFLDSVRPTPGLCIGWGQCLDQHGMSEAYLPILEALGRLCREPEGQELITRMAQAAPTWLVQMPWLITAEEIAGLQQRTSGTTRERMLREMVELLETFSREHPLVLVLEDLHWSDYSTVDLLAWLARRHEPARLLVIGTYRPADVQVQEHPLHPVVKELCLRGHAVELAPGFLSRAAVEAYLALRCPGIVHAQDLARLLHQRTEGSPLFLENVVNAWIEQGALVPGAGQWRLRAALDELVAGVPDTVRQLIEQQFVHLSPEDRALLEAASIAGMTFSAAAVAAGVRESDEAVELRCDRLARQGRFLQTDGSIAWPDGTIAAQYRFIHHLYQEVLAEQVTAARKVRLHRQIGERLEAGYGAHVEDVAVELAQHFVRGHDAHRAVRYLQIAAEQALRRSAHREAIEHITIALELLPRWPDSHERQQQELALLTLLAPAYIATKGWGSSESEQVYARAYELCQLLDDPSQRIEIICGRATMYEFRADYLKSQALMEERLHLPESRQSDKLLIESYDLLACSLFHQGSFADALAQADYGITLYNPNKPETVIAVLGENPAVGCHTWASLALWHLGYPDQALARGQQAIRLAEDHAYSLSSAQMQVAYIYQWQRDLAMTRHWADMAAAAAVQHGFPYRVAVGKIMHGWVLAQEGQPDEGIVQIEAGLAACRATGTHIDYPYFLALLAEAHSANQQVEEALLALAGALAMVRTSRTFFYEAELYRLKGVLLLQSGATGVAAEAEQYIEQALEIARRQGSRSLELRAAVSLARLWQQQDKTATAHALLAEITGWFAEGLDTADLREARALCDDLAQAQRATAQ